MRRPGAWGRGDPVLDELRPVRLEAEAPVPAGEVGLRVEHDRPTGGQFEGAFHQPGREAVAARVFGGGDAADAGVAVGVGQQPQRGDDLAVPLDPELAGVGFEVPAVQFRVGAVLLDDEHVRAQGEDAVEGDGVELGQPCVADVHVVRRYRGRVDWGPWH